MAEDKCAEFGEPTTCEEDPLVNNGHSPFAMKFDHKAGKSGKAFSISGWVNCENKGGSWINIWHIGPKNTNTPRNPALFMNVSNRRLESSHTRASGSGGNVDNSVT